MGLEILFKKEENLKFVKNVKSILFLRLFKEVDSAAIIVEQAKVENQKFGNQLKVILKKKDMKLIWNIQIIFLNLN